MEIRWLTAFIDRPEADAAEAFWLAVTGTTLSPRRGPGGAFATLVPPAGDPYLRVQKVKSGPGGCHLDLHVAPAELNEAGAKATALGATEVFREDGLIVFESPGRFPFCFVNWNGESEIPAPFSLTGTDSSRLDQLCLDIPAPIYEAEIEFWSTLTGWAPRTSTEPEFRSLVRPAGIPVRLLFQDLAESPPGARVTGHLDFASGDHATLAPEHVKAGAEKLASYPHWTVLQDPTGRPYCLTARHP